MQKFVLLCFSLLTLNVYAGPPPVDNALPPCDSSAVGPKPPCSMDSESITVPPKTPNQSERIIVPPEEPARGLPDRSRQPGDIVNEPRPGNNNGTLR